MSTPPSPADLLAAVPRPRATAGRVLAIDDAPRNLQLLGGILTERDYDVAFATNGEAGLERAFAHPPDLVLLDLMMPGIDGLEVCRRLRADPRTADVPIIFLTAAHEADLAARALDTGAVDCVGKPFHHSELLARVQTHVELKRTRDELRRIIAQKNELMSAVAHDLKNPLAAVRLSALLLRDAGLVEPDSRAPLVDEIVVACDSALDFIQQRLVRNAREATLERLHPGPLALEEVIPALLQRHFAAAAAKRITLDLTADAATGLISADAIALASVLDNFVSNAIKFSAPDSGVVIDARPVADGTRMRLAVRDQGPGLTAADQRHLFEPYRRLSAQPTGGESSTGLGLNIARDLTIRMGGHIGCDSTPGEGATFWIELPVVPGEASELSDR